MDPIHLSATAGPNGVLRLSIPVGSAGEFEVTIVATPKPADAGNTPTPEQLGWPAGYFERTAGAIPDFSVEPREVGSSQSPEVLQNLMGSIDDETFDIHLLHDLPKTEPLE